MALDLTALGQQVRQMSNSMAEQASATGERIAGVAQTYHDNTGREEHWAEAARLSRDTATWLLAEPREPLDTVRALPGTPQTYTLLASDGSQIDIDRHGVAACYVINTGRVFLRYGERSAARLSSQPRLYYSDDDLYISDGARRTPIEGNYLGVRRDIEELRAITEMDAALQDGDIAGPLLALQDGTLIRWTLAGAEKFVQQHFLRHYLDSLETLRERGIPVASYISRPRATEIVGTVRLMYCPDVDVTAQRGARCSECSDVVQRKQPASCSVCHGLVDADLLARRLQVGQRGPLFASMSAINIKEYGPHRIHFFYLRVGRELARVEVPEWVATDAQQIDLVHSLIYDQCVRGQGYPVALARAHEQAVIRTADRRAFERMVQSSLLRAELPASASSKRDSKERAAL
jgi:hypothetical protein